jgi:hypothetical protein
MPENIARLRSTHYQITAWGSIPTMPFPATPTKRWIDETGVVAVGVGLLWLFLLAIYLPGMMNADSVDMLCQAIHNQYHDWHSPLMSVVWRVLNAIVPGPSLMLVLVQGGFLLGAGLSVARLSASPFLRILAAVFIVFWPPIFADMGMVTKDSAFLSAYILFVAALSGAVIERHPSRWRMGAMLAATLCGTAIRTDGAVLFAPGLVFVYYLALDRPSGSQPARWRAAGFPRGVVSGALGLGTIALCVAAIASFHVYVLRVTPRYSVQVPMAFDIAGISVRAGENLMPDYIKGAGIDLTFLKERYHPWAHDALHFRPGASRNIPVTDNREQYISLREAWLRAVELHPLYYLDHRTALSAYLLDIEPPPKWELYFPITDPNYLKWCPALVGMDTQDQVSPLRSLVRGRIMPAFLGTPIYRGYFYSLAILMELSWSAIRLWRRRGIPWTDRLDALIVILGTGSALDQAVLFSLAPGAHFRYLLPIVLTSLIMTLLTATRTLGSNGFERTADRAT